MEPIRYTDWRDRYGYYQSREPCCICGKGGKGANGVGLNGQDSRFGYTLCEDHKDLTPIQVSERRIIGP